jgi:dihydrofolate reductase
VTALAPLAMIAAMGSNRVIGAEGRLPWHEPEDLKHFKATTTGHAVIMGRKTWEALGRPLPKRRNLVVTRQAGFSAPGAEVFTGLDAAIAAARRDDPEPMVIGGGEIYRLALPQATRIHLTEVRCAPAGDASFPELDPRDWRVASERASGNVVFRVYERV